MFATVIIYRKRKSTNLKSETSQSIGFTELSSNSSDSNVTYANIHLSDNNPSPYKVTNLSRFAVQFPNDHEDDETWKRNPLYMDMDELGGDYDEINRAEGQNEDDQDDELMDVPVDLGDFGDYVSIHDDRQGLIQ